MCSNNAKLFVVSGPSGSGVADVVSAVLTRRDDLGRVVPVTARKMKAGEQNGVGFYFYELEQWNAMRESGDLLEAIEFAGNDYGTSRALVNEQLRSGKNVLLNLEVRRAAQIKRNMPDAVCVYITPSSDLLLKERFEKISRNPLETSVRMQSAEKDRAAADFCDYTVFSDDLDAAAGELSALIDRLGVSAE